MNITISIIFLSFIYSIIFAFVDAFFFLIAQDNVQDRINKLSFMDNKSSEIMTGAISASISIFIALSTKKIFQNKTNFIENPFIDSVGILLGTVIFLFIYKNIKLN